MSDTLVPTLFLSKDEPLKWVGAPNGFLTHLGSLDFKSNKTSVLRVQHGLNGASKSQEIVSVQKEPKGFFVLKKAQIYSLSGLGSQKGLMALKCSLKKVGA